MSATRTALEALRPGSQDFGLPFMGMRSEQTANPSTEKEIQGESDFDGVLCDVGAAHLGELRVHAVFGGDQLCPQLFVSAGGHPQFEARRIQGPRQRI